MRACSTIKFTADIGLAGTIGLADLAKPERLRWSSMPNYQRRCLRRTARSRPAFESTQSSVSILRQYLIRGPLHNTPTHVRFSWGALGMLTAHPEPTTCLSQVSWGEPAHLTMAD